MKFILVEIHDTDDNHELGGQDLPNLVTVKVEGGSVEEALKTDFFDKLMPFNVQTCHRHRLPGYLEFLTFSFDTEIHEHFGVPRVKTKKEQDFERLFKSAYAMTVGELKAAIADLPDDLPLVHTPNRLPGEHLANRKGLHVHTGEWAFTGPGLPAWSDNAQWSLRISGLDRSDWDRVMDGSWRNMTAADLKG